VRWVEAQLPDAETNAKNIFGARGALFAIHPTSRGGPLTHFDAGWPHQYWISAGGWMYSPIWDYYLATGDKTFLREHVMPGLKEIGLFYEDYLKDTDKNGDYIFVPSYSPENYPRNSERVPAVINATMDISVCREVFTHLIAAAQVLGVDTEDVPRWQAILAKLPPYLADSDGSLKEWAWPTLMENQDHRHVSHLYGAWPGDEFTPDAAPQLARAALLAARKRGQGNASAHGILHRGLAAARLKDPYLVNFDLKQILEQGYVNPSLTTMHNPYAIPSPDPQGALPTLIMEMLVYSRPGVIGLLPAAPDSLMQGELKGVLCRTQAKIDDLVWNLKTRKIDVTISSRVDQTIELFLRDGIDSVRAEQGVRVGAVRPGAVKCAVRLTRDQPVTLHFNVGEESRSAWTSR
jgi:alpha-L-fucosidase 2